MNKLRKNSKQGLFGGKRNRYRETDSNKRYTTDPELIESFATKMSITLDDAKFIINEVVDSIRYLVDKNGTVTVRCLGTFYLMITKRSKVYHPRTREEIKIPLRYKVRFTPANSFKNAINNKVKDNLKQICELKENKDENT